MWLIKLMRRFFTRDEKPADAIAEAISAGIKETFKEAEYPFAEEE